MISDSERFIFETKRDDLKTSIEWLYSQETIIKVLFKRRLMSLEDANLDEMNKTREQVWNKRRLYYEEELIEQLRIEKMLGLASSEVDEEKVAQVFNKITEKYEHNKDTLRCIILDLIVDTYPKELLEDKNEYIPPTMKQIAKFLLEQGKRAIEIFFWPQNECYHLFTDKEREEIKSWIALDKT